MKMNRMGATKLQPAFTCAACGAAFSTADEAEEHELSCGLDEQQDTENPNRLFDEQDQ